MGLYSHFKRKVPFWLFRQFAKPTADGWWRWGKIHRRDRNWLLD